jgi:hypothetical protein
VGQKLDAAKPGEEVDVEYDAAEVNEHLRLYNEDLAVARDVWLRMNLSSDGIARLTELHTPVGLGLPMFASPAQAERARQQRLAISRRLGEQNASMDAWVTGISTVELAANAAGIVAGAGILVVAAKKGGTWAVVKVAAAGAAVIAADKAADAGLRAAGASEQTVRGVQLAAAIITLILLRRIAKKAAPQKPPSDATPSDAPDIVPALSPEAQSGVRILEQEGNTTIASFKVAGVEARIIGDVTREGDTLFIRGAHIQGDATLKEVLAAAQRYGREQGVKRVIIEGAKRTTGANPGHLPKPITVEVK